MSGFRDFDQFGFVGGVGTDDMISIARAILAVGERFGLPTWIASIDCIKAFGCVCHAELWAALAELGVPTVYIELLKQLCDANHAMVQEDTTSSPFPVEQGVRQGDPISPMLFSLASIMVFQKLHAKWRDG